MEDPSQVVAGNSNGMHTARQAFIQNESSEKIKRALTHQIRTSGDDAYTTIDLVLYKRGGSEQCHSPGTIIIGQEGKNSSQLKSRFIEIDSIDEELSEEPDNNSNIDINAINKNDDTELPVNNFVDDMKEKQAEANDLAKSVSRLSIHENSDSGIVIYDNKHIPSKMNKLNIKLKMAIHGINVNLYHALEKLHGSRNTTSLF